MQSRKVIVVGVSAVALGLIGYYLVQNSKFEQIELTQDVIAKEPHFTARDIEDVKNDAPAQMNLTAFDASKHYNTQSIDYCHLSEYFANDTSPIGYDNNPLVVKRGDNEFQQVQLCIDSGETYYRKLYITAEEDLVPQENVLSPKGLTVKIDVQALEIPAWQQPENKPPSEWVAYEKTIDVYVKADAMTEPGLHYFMVRFHEPSEYRDSESDGYITIGIPVYVEVRG